MEECISKPPCYWNGGDRMAQHKNSRNYTATIYPPYIGGLYCKIGLKQVDLSLFLPKFVSNTINMKIKRAAV